MPKYGQVRTYLRRNGPSSYPGCSGQTSRVQDFHVEGKEFDSQSSQPNDTCCYLACHLAFLG